MELVVPDRILINRASFVVVARRVDDFAAWQVDGGNEDLRLVGTNHHAGRLAYVTTSSSS